MSVEVPYAPVALYAFGGVGAFWGRVGFQLGQRVDRKEQKQATLSSLHALRGDVAQWTMTSVIQEKQGASREE